MDGKCFVEIFEKDRNALLTKTGTGKEDTFFNKYVFPVLFFIFFFGIIQLVFCIIVQINVVKETQNSLIIKKKKKINNKSVVSNIKKRRRMQN